MGIINFCVSAQTVYNGIVVSKKTNQPIPYASVGLQKQNTGTSADENGNFTIVSAQANDSLIITAIGFTPQKVLLNSLNQNKKIELIEKITTLQPIIINIGQKRYIQTLNNFDNCTNNYYSSNGTMTQIAQLFQAPNKNMFLTKISLCKLAESSIFRLRVYAQDSIYGYPTYDLYDSVIEINTAKKHVTYVFDKPVLLPSQHFFIAVEWLFIPYNQDKKQTKLKYSTGTIKTYTFSPHIGLKKLNSNTIETNKQLEMWQLDFRNRWLPFQLPPSRGNINFVIAATITD